MELKLYDDAGKKFDSYTTPDNNILVIYNDADLERPAYLKQQLRYLKFDDKHIIRQDYLQRVRELADRYSQHLCHLILYRIENEIVFIVDEAWEPSENASKNSAWKIDIVKAPYWLRAITGYVFMVKMRGYWLEKWSDAQINAAIMSQLLRINPTEDSVLKYTEDHNSRMIATFGAGYLEPNTVIPDLLKEDVKIHSFREASGQITIEELAGQCQMK